MADQRSYVGPGILKSCSAGACHRRFFAPKKTRLFAAVAVAGVLSLSLVYVGAIQGSDDKTEALSVTTLALMLFWQYHDTPFIPCIVPPLHAPGPHVWNDASGVDGVYGNADDCPHCSAYCAPASIAMIASYRGAGLPFVLQDWLYDQGKQVAPEITGNGFIETHGVGMFHGVGGQPPEVQLAMTKALGAINQHDWNPMNPKGPMTYPLLLGYMSTGTPILWLDNGGWPANSTQYPPLSSRVDQGHAKVIGGHDDMGTRGDPTDDLCLIFDPWPEYSDKKIVPFNCTTGPGGSWDPYWQPLNDVNFSDPNDVYLVDLFPAIPEFSTLVLPVIGVIVAVVSSVGFRRIRAG
jgi:hypothetical protein